MMKKFTDIDFMAGVVAGVYAVAALFVVELNQFVDAKAAGAFALAALGRWYMKNGDQKGISDGGENDDG